ncbi:hypothetical protein DTO96_102007 [Ephemeroptericola cinctiostellae]|uniref:DUF4760 domain-containing protein n=1 Tax=Ephemeroptericola cinctiostellae TaxID=2268024 RepID=A0A345DD23_9BURK|nr:hypothetical protein [Ephemeroptericola cinctiostellae]AXF86261.1 hypothetical protein DTO96_102007 [Ephemeroptericola cinctiostellae]
MELIKNIAAILGVIAAIWGLYKGVIEFALQGAQKRAEVFLKKQNEYFSNKSFNEIRTLLEKDEEKLKEIPIEEKRAYLTFFEEVAVLRNTGLIKPDLAYYMYGYYATKCLESSNFWTNINKNKLFWNVFIRFAEEMQNRLRNTKEIISHDIKF